jgi:hypothetical protein
MKMTRIIVFILSLLLLKAGGLNAQAIKQFSEDPLTFAGEIQQFFANISSPTTGMKVREVMEPFIATWSTPAYSDKERSLVIGGANALLQRKLPNYPDFYYFLITVHELKTRASRGSLETWVQDMHLVAVNGSLKQIKEYLEQYALITRDGILNQSSSFEWRVSDTNLVMDIDTSLYLVYKKTDLSCASKKDTSRVYQTGGRFYPKSLTWYGLKGKVTWERLGLDDDSIYAELSAYSVNLQGSEYQADSVKFINKEFFSEPLFGQLNDRVLSSPPGPGSSYPQFSSYLKNYEIRNLFKNIDYIGGFNVEGTKVIGSGEINENASLVISRNGRVLAQIRSNAFQIQGNQISANPASLSIITDGDSIYHPGLQLKYFDDKRQLIMYRPESGISESPFFNGYHEIDMDCGAIYWNLDRDTVEFQSVPSINPVSVNEYISNNFFSRYEFYKIQGIDEKNPLYIVRDYSRKFGTDEITPNALAQFMDKSPEQIKAMMLKLSIQGFLYYDLVNDKAIVQDRLNQYIEANAGKRDYDVIRIKSEVTGTSNASLSLVNYDMLLKGVEQVFLSDSQQVYIYPDNKEIILKRGLDFMFSGRVEAGLFDFYAHECSFEYDSFRLNMPMIDSLSLQVKSFEKNERGEKPLRKVGSVIEDLSGRLLIDFPTNKSGLGSFPAFPIFISEQESFVYYDHDTLYHRDRFAYHIDPFALDSLDNFTTDNLQFAGYLVSDGIFPDIGQPLKVQPDYSLGFVNRTPEDGLPVYKGRGKFFEEVLLSNQGLRGKGMVEFLTSTSLSDDFLFYPDTMITTLVKSFRIAPQVARVEYPSVEADTVFQQWYPYIDTMRVRTISKPFRMFDDMALLYGDLYYSSGGLFGKGRANFESVELASESFKFRHRTIDADTLDFRLMTKETGDLAVSAERYRTHVDFDARTVEFKTNQKGSTVSFPYNNFECYMDNIDWFMDRGEMKLYNDLGEKYRDIDKMSREQLLRLDLSGSDLLATNPLMDSLSFFSVTAKYDLKNYVIDAEDVKLIRVADAAIFPDSGNVRILQGGQIRLLKNAAIIADTASRYHLVERAEVNILSRKNYTGKGTYQYAGTDQSIQEFNLTDIGVDTLGRTFANGSISEEIGFLLDPHFAFKGNVSLLSVRRDMEFEGGFQTREDCFGDKARNWVYFKSWVDPSNVMIPLSDPIVDVEGGRLDLGIFISDYDEEIYACWFRPRVLSWDTTVTSAKGVISYDSVSEAYTIAPGLEAGSGGTEALRLDTRRCVLESDGPAGLGLNLNYIEMGVFGRSRYLVVPDSAIFNLSMSMDFLFFDAGLNMMADSLNKADLRGVDITGKPYQDYLDFLMGRTKADEMKNEIGLYGNIRRMPEELVHTLVLTDLDLVWNTETNSYISRGPIGILAVGRNVINRYVNGNLEIIRRRSGDVISFYLELTPQQWYFFDYRNGIMQTIASDMTYNSRIEDLKPEKRMMTKPGLEEPYEFVVSSRRKLIDFLRRMEEYNN